MRQKRVGNDGLKLTIDVIDPRLQGKCNRSCTYMCILERANSGYIKTGRTVPLRSRVGQLNDFLNYV